MNPLFIVFRETILKYGKCTYYVVRAPMRLRRDQEAGGFVGSTLTIPLVEMILPRFYVYMYIPKRPNQLYLFYF